MSVSSAADVVVVGAGMAGLYCAWRLKRADPTLHIEIFERLHRIGGRLETDQIEIHGVPVQTEEGGMRFMDSQRELVALLRTLRLEQEIIDFPMGDKNNLYYVRGHRFSVGEALADPSIWSRLYRLDQGSVGKQPGKILLEIRDKILADNGQDPSTWKSNPESWTDFRLRYTYNNIETYRWGFWSLLENYGLSEDCIQMLYDASGFIAPYDQMVNAGCAFQLLADFVDPRFLHLRSGYSALPAALAKELDNLGVPIHLNHSLSRFDLLYDGRVNVAIDSPAGSKKYQCRELILAVTQQSLQKLTPQVPMFREGDLFMSDLESVVDMPLGKINLYYEHNWWSSRFNITSGACFTDLALAQVYFFQQQHSDPCGPNSLTIYSDYYRSNFWSEAQLLGEPYHTALFPANPEGTIAASTYVVETATRQLKELFSFEGIPLPVLTTYKRWSNPCMGDGDHQWRIGAFDPDIRQRLVGAQSAVHICGESYSDDQAWVNGALRSVDEVLQSHFRLKPLPPNDCTSSQGSR